MNFVTYKSFLLICNFDQDCDFLPKLAVFQQDFYFNKQISMLKEHFTFRQFFRFSNKISVSDK